MEETALIKDRKPLLTVEQQIDHLKSKGVTFELCSEEDAAEYLSERTYFFKVAAYRSLFEKRVGGPRDGQYIDLDFGHLKALASLDRDLRYALLPLTLDVEHAARTKLVRIATERDGEDGYALSRDYMASLNHNERRRREGEVNMMGNDLFCGDLVRKYGGGPAEMPIWVLMELFSFGSFIDLYLFCAEHWGDREMVHEHYMLRQAKSVRNACAHSSDVLNGVARRRREDRRRRGRHEGLGGGRAVAPRQDGQDEEPPHQADHHVDVPACAAGARGVRKEKHGIESSGPQKEAVRNERPRARQRRRPIDRGFFGEAD